MARKRKSIESSHWSKNSWTSTSLAKETNSFSFVSPTHSFTYNLESSNPNHEHSMVQKICRESGSSGTSKYDAILSNINKIIISRINIYIKQEKYFIVYPIIFNI